MSTTATSTTVFPTPDGDPPLWPISVAKYSQMVKMGILTDDDPVYLWQGRLAPLMPIHRPHSLSVRGCFLTLHGLAPAGYHVEQEQPLAFRLEPSVPQPDVTVLRGRAEDYLRDFPTTEAAVLVVEVADTTLARDRRRAASYAAEGVPVYWIVNIPERSVEVHSDPVDGSYTQRSVVGPDDTVHAVIDGQEVGRLLVRELLPPVE